MDPWIPLVPKVFGVSGIGLVRVTLKLPLASVVPTPALRMSKTPLPCDEMSM